jgi:NTP pyrophosphatase (non-canonical NTP hydrolase)
MQNTKINLKEYQELCKRTAKPFEDKEKEAACYGLGISGEAGDVSGCIKKTLFHGDDQTQGIRENLGDTMWYIAMIANLYGWNLEEVLTENIAKLKKRYAKGFSEKEAARGNKRIDWNEDSK